MALIFRTHNLNRARDRLERVSSRQKEFQINFVRSQQRNQRFRTTPHIVRGVKEHHGGKGLLHRAYHLKFRVKGDKPSLTRAINNFEPQTKVGKFVQTSAKVTNFIVHDVAQTAVDVSLAGETVGINYWKFTESTEDLLDELFQSEYEFVYWYDNTSHWEYRYQFESNGYYSISGSGVSGSYGYIDISYPDALPVGNVTDGNTLYYDLNNSEILNYNDDYSATGWYLKNQYVDDYDSSGAKYEGWYQNGEECSYGIYEDDVLKIPCPYVIPENSWISVLKMYDWKTDCRLYYSVKQKDTFENLILNKLKNMSLQGLNP